MAPASVCLGFPFFILLCTAPQETKLRGGNSNSPVSDARVWSYLLYDLLPA
jgi:hypothetical protein